MKTVLFDLDGTLLPMDQDVFTQGYFKALTQTLSTHGYDEELLTKTVWGGTRAMVRNDGSKSNFEAFWDYFASVYGSESRKDIPLFDAFYENEFDQVKAYCGFDPRAAKTVRYLQEQGIRTVLATNPLFPDTAQQKRIRWAGLRPEDFDLYTTYENTGSCKPNPAYYRDVLTRLGANASDCLMVGNDAEEDMVAESLGMEVFLLTDWIVNKKGADPASWPNGGYDELMVFLKERL